MDNFKLYFTFMDPDRLFFLGDTVDLKKSFTVLDANGKQDVDVVVMIVVSASLSSISSSNSSLGGPNPWFYC